MVKRFPELLRSALGIVIAATVTASAGMPPSPAEIGKAAPPFALTDLSGTSHSLSDFKGKVVVLEWTNPNCPFVERVYRDGIMNSLQKEYVEKGVVWLTINSTNKNHGDYETPEALKKTYGDWKAAYTGQLMDSDGKVGKMYEAKTTPHMYIIDARGMLVYNGALDDDPRGSKSEKVNYVRAALDRILAGTDVATSTTKPYGCSVKY